MTKDEALRLALEALENITSVSICEATHHAKKDRHLLCEKCPNEMRHLKAITAIKAALEAKDEPWSPVSIGVDVTKEGTHVIAMRLRPNGVNEVIYSQFHPLSQQESKDEPVAFFDWYDNAHWGNEDFKEGCHRAWNAAIKYTTPPQRTWVGLTEKDICEAAVKSQEGISPRDDTLRFAIAIEAKLKEKNT
jgi:hypothetical protein